MDGFVLPISAAWFVQNSIISTPDNGLLYCSRYDVSYIPQVEKDCLPKIRLMNNYGLISSLACAPDWSEQRLFATLDENGNVLVWDVDAGKAINGHRGHASGSKKPTDFRGKKCDLSTALCFTQNRKLLSCDPSKFVVYCLLSDSYTVHTNLFKPKNVVVVLEPSPVDRDVFIAGMKDGLIQIFSIKTMTILHSLRAHDKEIVSIACMAVPVMNQTSPPLGKAQKVKQPTGTTPAGNVQQITEQARPKKQARKKTVPEADTSDLFDIYDFNESQEEFGTIFDRESQSQQNQFREKTKTVDGFNFLEACEHLKDDIMKAATRREEDDDDDADEEDADEHSRVRQESFNTDDENELDDCEKLRDFVVIDSDAEHGEHNDDDDDDEEPNEEVYATKLILMSAGREENVWFWDYDTGLPIGNIVTSKAKPLNAISRAIFSNAVWLDKGRLVVNDSYGNVVEWKVNFSMKNDQLFLHSEIQFPPYPVEKVIFISSAKNVIKNSAENNQNCTYLWCYSINQNIVCLQVPPNGKPFAALNYSCIMPIHHCMLESPLESMVISMGCVHNIAIINLANIQYDDIPVRQLNETNRMPTVMCLDWHPEDEHQLAFGSDDGRIGIMNIEKLNKTPIFFKPFTKKVIYALKWCYLTCSDGQRKLVLFASGKSELAYYHKTETNGYEPIACKQFGDVSQFSAVNNLCFVGTQNGKVYICDLDRNLQQLYCRKIAKRYISALEFKANWLAVGPNDTEISLINFADGIDDKTDKNITLLEGHKDGICKLRWNRGDSYLLVSCSFDGSIRVWNALSGTCLSVLQTGWLLYGAMFSPLDENIILYIGKGCSLCFFDYTKRQHKTLPGYGKNNEIKYAVRKEDESKKAKPKAAGRGRAVPGASSHAGSMHPKPEVAVDKLVEDVKAVSLTENPFLRSNVLTTFQLAYREVNRSKDVLECIVKLLHTPEPEPEPEVSVNAADDSSDYDENDVATELREFQSLKIESKQTEETVEQSICTEADDGKVFYNEKLFTTEEKLKQLIQEEVDNHQASATSSIGTIILPQLLHKLKEMILEQVSKKKLTPQLLALTPHVSHMFWRQCCQAYAYQLIESQQTLAAVPYFLACHNVDDSIEALCDGKYYREAWAVCRLQKMPGDPVLEKVSTDWANHLESNGNLEGAALVWTGVKKYQKALDVLSKRRNITDDIQRTIDELTAKIQEATVSDESRNN